MHHVACGTGNFTWPPTARTGLDSEHRFSTGTSQFPTVAVGRHIIKKNLSRTSGYKGCGTYKKNEILPCATIWMDLEGAVLSEVSQLEQQSNETWVKS